VPVESGEKKAWELLAAADPGVISRAASVAFDPANGLYHLKSFDAPVTVSPGEKKIFSTAQTGELVLNRFSYFSRLSILWYLVSSRDIPLSGRLVNPLNLKGGQLFFRGTHVLPLDKLAEKYGNDAAGFLDRGSSLGGVKAQYGDASIVLYPLPRVPATVLLWQGDPEFPPRASILFDSTCEAQLPLDVLWSVAMLSVLIMM